MNGQSSNVAFAVWFADAVEIGYRYRVRVITRSSGIWLGNLSRLRQEKFEILAPQAPNQAVVSPQDGVGELSLSLLQLEYPLFHRISRD